MKSLLIIFYIGIVINMDIKTNDNFDIDNFKAKDEHSQKIIDFLKTKVKKIINFLDNL